MDNNQAKSYLYDSALPRRKYFFQHTTLLKDGSIVYPGTTTRYSKTVRVVKTGNKYSNFFNHIQMTEDHH
jgi:hypothetical protein